MTGPGIPHSQNYTFVIAEERERWKNDLDLNNLENKTIHTHSSLKEYPAPYMKLLS